MEIQSVELSKLHPYTNNPFRVSENAEMRMLIDSIRASGVIEPLIVRPDGNGEYEIIAGHRRYYACQKLGFKKVPVYAYEMSDREAIVTLVDSNLYRDGLLPSEKAFAFKMKYEALKHQGRRTDLTSGQIGTRSGISAKEIAQDAGESERTVWRFIRLTYLIPELLKLVDDRKMGFTPAVELSYLPEGLQRALLETIESELITPTLSQAQRMRKAHENGTLDADGIFGIMTERKPNQKETLTIPEERIRGYFSETATREQMQEAIVKALAFYSEYRRRIRRGKDAR